MEKVIRATLPRLSMTSGKQYFLAAEHVGTHSRINRREKAECRACVCVPQDAVSSEFFSLFDGNDTVDNI